MNGITIIYLIYYLYYIICYHYVQVECLFLLKQHFFCGNVGYAVCVLKDIQYLYCKPRETTDGNIIIYNIPLSPQFLMYMPSCVWSPLLYIKINHHCFIWYLVWFIIYISIHLCLVFFVFDLIMKG